MSVFFLLLFEYESQSAQFMGKKGGGTNTHCNTFICRLSLIMCIGILHVRAHAFAVVLCRFSIENCMQKYDTTTNQKNQNCPFSTFAVTQIAVGVSQMPRMFRRMQEENVLLPCHISVVVQYMNVFIGRNPNNARHLVRKPKQEHYKRNARWIALVTATK